jgi:hypothetical protein
VRDGAVRWPPEVLDYVHVTATGELGRVMAVARKGDRLRFLVSVYPQAEGASPHIRRLVATSPLQLLYGLDELEPDGSLSPTG